MQTALARDGADRAGNTCAGRVDPGSKRRPLTPTAQQSTLGGKRKLEARGNEDFENAEDVEGSMSPGACSRMSVCPTTASKRKRRSPNFIEAIKPVPRRIVDGSGGLIGGLAGDPASSLTTRTDADDSSLVQGADSENSLQLHRDSSSSHCGGHVSAFKLVSLAPEPSKHNDMTLDATEDLFWKSSTPIRQRQKESAAALTGTNTNDSNSKLDAESKEFWGSKKTPSSAKSVQRDASDVDVMDLNSPRRDNLTVRETSSTNSPSMIKDEKSNPFAASATGEKSPLRLPGFAASSAFKNYRVPTKHLEDDESEFWTSPSKKMSVKRNSKHETPSISASTAPSAPCSEAKPSSFQRRLFTVKNTAPCVEDSPKTRKNLRDITLGVSRQKIESPLRVGPSFSREAVFGKLNAYARMQQKMSEEELEGGLCLHKENVHLESDPVPATESDSPNPTRIGPLPASAVRLIMQRLVVLGGSKELTPSLTVSKAWSRHAFDVLWEDTRPKGLSDIMKMYRRIYGRGRGSPISRQSHNSRGFHQESSSAGIRGMLGFNESKPSRESPPMISDPKRLLFVPEDCDDDPDSFTWRSGASTPVFVPVDIQCDPQLATRIRKFTFHLFQMSDTHLPSSFDLVTFIADGMPNLRFLELSGKLGWCDSFFLSRLAKSETLPKTLDTLRLRDSVAQMMSQQALVAYLPRFGLLKNLVIEECDTLDDDVLSEIARCCRSLVGLSLSVCRKITDRGLVRVANSTASLRLLEICQCPGVGDAIFAPLPETLHTLSLCYLPNLTTKGLLDWLNGASSGTPGPKRLRKFRRLTTLILNGFPGFDVNALDIVASTLGRDSNLRTLIVRDCYEVYGAEIERPFRNLTRLTTLDLSLSWMLSGRVDHVRKTLVKEVAAQYGLQRVLKID